MRLKNAFPDDHQDQLRAHHADFIAAYNFARKLKTLNGLMPYQYICKIWTSEAEKFMREPIHRMPELSTEGPLTKQTSKATCVKPESANAA